MADSIRLIRPQYSIVFKIGEHDYSLYLESVLLINSIKSVYPIIAVSLKIDSKEMSIFKVGSNTNYYMNVMLTSEDSKVHENIEIDLLLIHSKMSYSSKNNNESPESQPEEKNEDSATMIFIAKNPYLAMFSDVTKVVSRKRKPKPPSESIGSSISKIGGSISAGIGGLFSAGISGGVSGKLGLNIGSSVTGFVSGGAGSNVTTESTQQFNKLSKQSSISTGAGFSSSIIGKYLSSDFNNYSMKDFKTSENVQESTDIQISYPDENMVGIDYESYSKTTESVIQQTGGNIESTKTNIKNLTSIISNASQTSIQSQYLDNTQISGNNNQNKFNIGNILKESMSKANGVNLVKIKDTLGLSNSSSDDAPGGKTPYDLVKSLYSTFVKDVAESKFISNNKNNEKMEQFTTPKKTFVSAVRDVNDRFGIFNGPMFLYCDLDNQLCLWDLSKIVDRNPIYKIKYLSTGDNDDKEIQAEDDSMFYTFDPIDIQNKGNSDTMSTGYKHVVLVKPKNKFFSKIDINLQDVSTNYAVGDGEQDIADVTKNRTRFHNSLLTGDSDKANIAVIKSKLAKEISASAVINIKLSGNLRLTKLTKIGQPVEVIPTVTEYMNMRGKYIVASSTILISRKENALYSCNAHISMFRNNPTID